MLPIAARSKLVSDAQAVFGDVCRIQMGDMKHAPEIETDFSGSFVKNGIPRLHKKFDGELARHGIKTIIQAVYIHQSPMVEIHGVNPVGRSMKTQKCELGDILFVQSHRRNPRKTYWRAALWQLKMDTGTLQKAEDPQFWLYEQWPPFHVYRGGLQSDPRDLRQAGVRDPRSGYFALVSDAGWNICPPSAKIGPTSAGIIDAGAFLVGMMYDVDPQQDGRTGLHGRRVFTRPEPAAPLSWSQTIWDILNTTAARDFNARKLFADPQTRSSFMLLGDVRQQGFLLSGPPVRASQSADMDEPRGLYVVHVSVDASEFTPEERLRRPIG